MDRELAIRYLNGLARALGPDNLGAPVDAAAAALNLGLAGVGYAGHKAGLLKEPLALIEKPVGGSDWIAEKLGNADDGSGAYTAGRLTPLAVGLARMGGAGAAKLTDKMLTQGPAAHGRAAQRGAIRVSRGPGDKPDPELVLSTSMNQELLPELMTKGGSAELYSPSMGIKRGQVMTEFGDLALIPKLGAFDPATSPSTLFNRDAYTARWHHFDGRAAKDALKRRETALKYTGVNDNEVAERFLRGDFAGDGVVFQGKPLAEHPEIAPLLERFQEVAKSSNPYTAFDRLTSLDTDYYDPQHFQGFGMLHQAISGLGGGELARIQRAPDLAKQARARMQDRAVPFTRPEDLRMNEGGSLGIPQKNDPLSGGYGGFWHDLSMETSPAFRSFQAFERNPLGAGLLRKNHVDQNAFQRKVRERGFGDNFGWLNSSAQEAAVRLVPRGPGELRDILAGEALDDYDVGAALRQDFIRNGFTPEQMVAAAPELYKAAALVRRGIQHTPSDYAELKVMGSVPVNPESFAGAIVRGQALPNVRDALQRLGLPMVESSLGASPEEQLQLVNALQRGLAAPRQPAK